ncbi:ABC transporter permease [Janibacter cremeus]|uniref:NitT/TauT family transport system permease protein n=1 Tax=Janibacter cremeus TaxID=1285192 RepID=A0A852VTT4_9MICO|nr:ABC transporter permease subunit [Janibacter cremeus]NYF98073.1 NitT/TauT family transport system permease protein [Janibacter cremeus]
MQLIHEPLSTRRQIVLGVVGVVGVAALAEVLMSTVITKDGLPVPSRVMGSLGDLFSDSAFWEAVGFTLAEWMLGLLLATVAGVLVGAAMGASKAAMMTFSLPVEAFRVLPSIALGPILVLLLGSGMLPLAITVALACVWPILLNTMYGVRGADTTAIQTAESFGLSRAEVVRRVILPSALPFAFTGVRVAASIGLIVAVSAELLVGAGAGIGGYILLNSANATNLDLVYAATLVAGVLGVLVSLVMSLVDAKVFDWKKGLAQ